MEGNLLREWGWMWGICEGTAAEGEHRVAELPLELKCLPGVVGGGKINCKMCFVKMLLIYFYLLYAHTYKNINVTYVVCTECKQTPFVS